MGEKDWLTTARLADVSNAPDPGDVGGEQEAADKGETTEAQQNANAAMEHEIEQKSDSH